MESRVLRRTSKEKVDVMGAAKTVGRFALTVLNAQEEFGIKRGRHQPRHARAWIAQTILAKKPAIDERQVDKIPRVRMRRIEAPELGEVLAAFDLKVPRQRHGFEEGLLGFDGRFA